MFFYFIGKLLCKVCECKQSHINCSVKGLYHMPWTKKQFGLNITWYAVNFFLKYEMLVYILVVIIVSANHCKVISWFHDFECDLEERFTSDQTPSSKQQEFEGWVLFEFLWKTHVFLFFSFKIARVIMLLLINNIHHKIMQNWREIWREEKEDNGRQKGT